jgi:hypothetical protein
VGLLSVEFQINLSPQFRQVYRPFSGAKQRLNKKPYRHPYMTRHRRLLVEYYRQNKLAVLMYMHLLRLTKRKRRRRK